jgi:type VII secretion-associated protein (TIGR03931 family)
MDRPGMTEPVVVVGPAAVCGPGTVDATSVAVALEAIDDRLAVHADRVVVVRELWGEVMRAALAGRCEAAVLVVPSWWPRSRVELVEEALLGSCAHVSVLPRGGNSRFAESHVVELGPDCVVVHAAAGERIVLPVAGRRESVADAVLATLPEATSVVLDVPDGVPESSLLAGELARRLRTRGITVTSLDDDGVRCAVMASRQADAGERRDQAIIRTRNPRVAVAVGAAVVLAALVGAAMNPGADGHESAGVSWVVEGRVAVEVPADWQVQRVTSGPGSARLQMLSPREPLVGIHLTQARVGAQETPQRTAEAMRAALDEQPRGLFSDFSLGTGAPDGPVVTYRERRSAIGVDWAVMLDGGVRIAVGCQYALDRPEPDPACGRATRSAHVLP